MPQSGLSISLKLTLSNLFGISCSLFQLCQRRRRESHFFFPEGGNRDKLQERMEKEWRIQGGIRQKEMMDREPEDRSSRAEVCLPGRDVKL